MFSFLQRKSNTFVIRRFKRQIICKSVPALCTHERLVLSRLCGFSNRQLITHGLVEALLIGKLSSSLGLSLTWYCDLCVNGTLVIVVTLFKVFLNFWDSIALLSRRVSPGFLISFAHTSSFHSFVNISRNLTGGLPFATEWDWKEWAGTWGRNFLSTFIYIFSSLKLFNENLSANSALITFHSVNFHFSLLYCKQL